MGLLDDFSGFVKTPEGQGLLSAIAGGLAGARRGAPINSLGTAGLAGLQGYSKAQDNEIARPLKEAQLAEAMLKVNQHKRMQEFLLTAPPEVQKAADIGVTGGDLYNIMNPKPKIAYHNGQVLNENKLTPEGMPTIVGSLPAEKTPLEKQLDAAGIVDPTQRQRYIMQGVTKATTHAPTAVLNANNKQETEEAKTIGKSFGEAYAEMMKNDMAASGKIARYDRMGQLLEGVNTGRLTPAGTDIAAYAKSVGLNIDDKLGNKQAAEALSNELALQLRNPSGGAGMPGALSDADRNFLVSMTPGLGKDAQSNKLIIDSNKKLAQRDRDVARIARQYRKKNGSLDEGFYEELATFSDKNPLFTSTKPGPVFDASKEARYQEWKKGQPK